MEWIFLAIGLVGGAGAGALLAQARAQARIAGLTAELHGKTEALAALEPVRAENDALRAQAARADVERASAAERAQWVEKAQESLREAFAALASQALATNAEEYLKRSRSELSGLLNTVKADWGTHKEELRGLVAPLETSLKTLDSEIKTMEEKRATAYGSIERQISTLATAQSQLQTTTTTLAQAMKSSTARGRWGELQLRRIAELAGMEDHIDFDEQASTDEGRPDMVVHLPGGGIIPVDAKASAAAYFAALEAEGDARRAKLADHVKATRLRIQELAKKQYWDQFPRAPEMVVMFMPIESALAAAFEEDPELLDAALRQRVLVASPVTLLALLRTAAFGWQEARLAEGARAIADEARKLCDLVANVAIPFGDVGKHLDKSVDAYNKAVASLEGRLLPAVRRLRDMTASEKELPELTSVDTMPRLPLEPAA